MRTSYCQSQISLAKNYCIFQLSCTIIENKSVFLRKSIEKQVAHGNKKFLGKKQLQTNDKMKTNNLIKPKSTSIYKFRD